MLDTNRLTPEEVEEMKFIIKETVSQTVRETLFQIGIIVEDSDDVIEFRKDMSHLRKWRNTVEGIENKSTTVTVSVLITGMLAALWLGVQAAFAHH